MAKAKDFDCQRFRDHLRRLTPSEVGRLRKNIEREGCASALVVGVVGRDRYLIDGFHRKEICEALGVDYATREVAFASVEAIGPWIEEHNGGRRNQTRTERLYYLGARYNREKRAHGSNQHTNGRSGQRDHSSDAKTCERLATQEGTSAKTVRRAGKLAAAIDAHCRGTLSWLRDLVLSEQVQGTLKLLEALGTAGEGGAEKRGGYEAVVRGLLAANPEKQVTLAMIRKALGEEKALPAPKAKATSPVEFAERVLPELMLMASAETSAEQLEIIVRTTEAYLAQLRAMLKTRRQ